MSSGPRSEKNLDTSNISAELLLLTLVASRAGLFYTPMSATAAKSSQVKTTDQVREADQSWSLNIGPLFGLPESLDDASQLLNYVIEEDRPLLMQCIVDTINKRRRETDCEYRILRPDGQIRWLLSRILLGVDESNGPRYLASMCFDITEQKQAQENLEKANRQLETAQQLFHSALTASKIAIFRYAQHEMELNLNGDREDYDTWNYNLAQIYGYPADTVMTPELQISRIKKEDFEAITTKAVAAFNTGLMEYEHEYPIQWDDQSIHWLLSKCITERDEQGNITHISGAVIDITDRKLAEEQTKFIATHDVLTKLPNRFLFGSLLTHAIQTASRYENCFAVFFIDLDRFKSINDALGHQAGDQLLIRVAERLRKCLRASDVLARISGDEFVLMAPEVDNLEKAGVVARKIIAEIARPLVLAGQDCQVTASIGIALYPDHGIDEETLMKNADSAMYAAKEIGKNNYQFFNSQSTSQSLERMAMENALRNALANDEFHLQYQAKLDLQNNSITGVEALLRWNNPKYGSVSPAQFIPIAEETGMIVPMGRWVLKTACAQNMAWQRQGLPPICIAVNISARQFLSKDLLNHIREALEESGMDPKLLELEITESMVMHNVEQALAQLHEIKNLGARIAIDDFGTGYSSLAQLKRFPIDTLKVDRSFIREVDHDEEDQAITDAIIAMGKSLSLTIIAEGVETREQQDFLRSHACDEMQGFYFSEPLSAPDFSSLLKNHSLKLSD